MFDDSRRVQYSLPLRDKPVGYAVRAGLVTSRCSVCGEVGARLSDTLVLHTIVIVEVDEWRAERGRFRRVQKLETKDACKGDSQK